jgi:WD40 repeat protein
MSRRTFWSVVWMIGGCGVLALVWLLIIARPLDRATVPLWEIKAYKHAAESMAFTADGKTLVASGSPLKSWDIASKRVKNQILFKRAPEISPGGKFYAVRNDGVISRTAVREETVADTAESQIRHRARLLRSEVTGAPEATYATIKSRVKLHARRSVLLFRTQDNSFVRAFPLPDDTMQEQRTIDSVGFSGNGSYLFAGMRLQHPTSDDSRQMDSFFVWHVGTGRQVSVHPSPRKESPLSKRCSWELPKLNSNGHQLFSLEAMAATKKLNRGGAYLRDELSGSSYFLSAKMNLKEPLWGNQPYWTPTVLSADNKYLAAVYKGPNIGNEDDDGAIYLFDIKQRRYLWKHWTPKFNPISLAFSPDGKLLACGGQLFADDGIDYSKYASRGKLFILNVATGRLVFSFNTETWQDRLRQANIKRTTSLRRLFAKRSRFSGMQLFVPGDSGPVKSLAFSPDSKTLAAGYTDGSIKLWRVPQR